MARAFQLALIALPLLVLVSTKLLAAALPFFAVVALLSFGLTGNRQFAKQWRSHAPMVIFLALLLVWPLLSGLWAYDGAQSLDLWLRTFVLFIAGAYLIIVTPQLGEVPDRVLKGMALVAIGILSVIAVESIFGIPAVKALCDALGGDHYKFMIKNINRGLAALAVLVWPLFFALHYRGHRALAFAVLTLSAATIFSLETISAMIGIAAGFAVWLLLCFLPKHGAGLLRIAIPLCLLGLPLLTYWLIFTPELEAARQWLTTFSAGRMPIWESLIENSTAHRILGWGMGMTPHIPYSADLPQKINFYSAPMHPHHSALQVVLELGAIGLLLFTAALAWLTGRIAAIRDIRARGSALVILSAYLVTGLFSFGIWQGWWVACAWLAAIFWRLTLAQRA